MLKEERPTAIFALLSDVAYLNTVESPYEITVDKDDTPNVRFRLLNTMEDKPYEITVDNEEIAAPRNVLLRLFAKV